jgi:Family of unknown function (DUF6328)
VFQEGFARLNPATRLIDSVAQGLMAITIGLLIAPSMHHLIAEKGQDTLRLHRATGLFAGFALLPFGISLGLSFYIVFDRLYGTVAAVVAGTAFCLLALLFWYGIGLLMKPDIKNPTHEKKTRTPLHTKIDQMLTEARVILPGAQALLGFQLIVTLIPTFEQLPPSSRLLHVAALISVAFAIILLMTPAALHRISFRGEDTDRFFRIGSWFVVLAPVPLALGIAADLWAEHAAGPDRDHLAIPIGDWSVSYWIGLWCLCEDVHPRRLNRAPLRAKALPAIRRGVFRAQALQRLRRWLLRAEALSRLLSVRSLQQEI